MVNTEAEIVYEVYIKPVAPGIFWFYPGIIMPIICGEKEKGVIHPDNNNI